MFTLYAAPGACSRVPLITLEEADAKYELKLIRFLKGAHKQPDYLALNPKGKVPCLVTPDGPLTENVAIATYLAATFPNLMPAGKTAYDAARLTADLCFCATTLHPIVSRMRVPMFMAKGEAAVTSVKEHAIEAMHPMAQVVEDRLSKQEWWLGHDWSILDAYLYWVFFRISGGGFPANDYPGWVAHAARMDQRPAVKRALAREAHVNTKRCLASPSKSSSRAKGQPWRNLS